MKFEKNWNDRFHKEFNNVQSLSHTFNQSDHLGSTDTKHLLWDQGIYNFDKRLNAHFKQFTYDFDLMGASVSQTHFCFFRHTAPYYQEKNPQINAWNAGKTRQPGPIFQRPPPQAWVRPQHGPPQRQYDNNQAQQGGRGRGGPRFNNPQRPQKSEPVRNKAKTKEIEEQLKAIFPENGDKISEILQNHRCETDLEKLTNYLMNAVFPS